MSTLPHSAEVDNKDLLCTAGKQSQQCAITHMEKESEDAWMCVQVKLSFFAVHRKHHKFLTMVHLI